MFGKGNGLTSIGVVVIVVFEGASLLSLKGLVLNLYELDHLECVFVKVEGSLTQVKKVQLSCVVI
jgi:hypothetical protein